MIFKRKKPWEVKIYNQNKEKFWETKLRKSLENKTTTTKQRQKTERKRWKTLGGNQEVRYQSNRGSGKKRTENSQKLSKKYKKIS